MKYLRNLRTGRLVVYDASLLELGRYEVYDDQAEAVKEEPPAQVAPVAEDSIKSAARNLLKRKPRSGGGLHDEVGATEKISIQLTRG